MHSSFDSLGSLAGACLGASLLGLAALGLGWVCTGPGGRARPRAKLLAIRAAVGLTLIAWLGLAAGALGWLAGVRSIVLVCALAPLGVVTLWRERGCWAFNKARLARWRPALAIFLPILLTLGPALCYPTGWDELVYHHELPRRWLADGWPAFYPDLPYSGFPSLGEMLFWLVGPLEHTISPRLIAWLGWANGQFLVYCLLRRRLAPASAATVTAAFSFGGAVLMVSANCYVESLLLMNTAALWLLLESARLQRHLPPWRVALLVGVLAGGAAAIKLTGLAIAIVPGFWFGARAWRSARWRPTALMQFGVYFAVAALVALPFYARPWLLTGNPFYPYYAQWFSSDPARLEMSRYHHALGDAFGLRTLPAFFTGPLLLAVADVFLGPDPLYDGAFGLQYIVLGVLAAMAVPLVARKRLRPQILWPALLASWWYVFWFLTAQQARFAIPAALALVLWAAAGLRLQRGKRRVAYLAVLLGLTVISVPWRTTGHYLGSWMAAAGIIRPLSYVDISTGGQDSSDRYYVPLLKALEEHVPADGRLLTLFEHRLFYLPRNCEIGTPFFQEVGFTPPEDFETPERLLQRLTNRGITHVVLPNAPAGPDQVPGWFDRFARFLPCFGESVQQGKVKIVWQSERYVLLAVTEPSPPADPLTPRE